MAAFTFFIKEHFNPLAQIASKVVWHADICLQKAFDGVSRHITCVTDFNSIITPPLLSRFCNLQAFKVRFVSRFMQEKKQESFFTANEDAQKQTVQKRNLFQPYRFR